MKPSKSSALFVAAAVTASLSLTAGCSSSDGSSGANDSNSTFANGANLGDAGSNGSAVDGGAGDGQPPPQSLACQNLASQAETNAEEEYYQSGQVQVSNNCQTDADCVLFDSSPACNPGCPNVYSKVGAAAIQSAEAAANSNACAPFYAQGCAAVAPSCGAQTEVATCMNNYCTLGFPAAWSSLAMESDTGGTGSTLPAACTGASCTSWTVTPDGTIVTASAAGTKTAQLASGDFSTIDTLLRSSEFRQGEMYSFSCDLPAKGTTQHVTESVTRTTLLMGTDVTGCVTAGPAGNDFLTLYNVLKNY